MISDPATRTAIAQDWTSVQKLSSTGLYSRATSTGWHQVDRPDEAFNLPLVLAYAVLDQVLTVLRDQGLFSCSGWQLGPKMVASRPHLPWSDYDTVDEGRNARNTLAHEAVLLPKAECLHFIDAIERELKGWGIL